MLAGVLEIVAGYVPLSLLMASVLVLARLVFRRKTPSLIACWILLFLLFLLFQATGDFDAIPWMRLVVAAFDTSILLTLLLRAGLLSFTVSVVVSSWFLSFPIALQTSAWTLPATVLTLGLVVAIGLYGL